MKSTPYVQHGPVVLNNGYRFTPVRHASKASALDGWSANPISGMARFEQTKRRYIDCGLAIVTGEVDSGVVVAGFDVDVLDDGVARSLVEHCRDAWGTTCIRYGKRPKALILMRLDRAVRKMASASFHRPGAPAGEKPNRIELLVQGQYFVSFGVHPETGGQYEWEGDSPLTVAAGDLPLVTLRQVEDAFALFEQYASVEDWAQAEGPTGSGDRLPAATVPDDDSLAHAVLLPEHEHERFVAALTAIDPDVGNDEFRNIVFAICATGLPDWLDLARRWADGTLRGTPSVKYFMDADGRRKLSRDRADKQFRDRFKKTKPDGGVHWETVYYFAHESGQFDDPARLLTDSADVWDDLGSDDGDESEADTPLAIDALLGELRKMPADELRRAWPKRLIGLGPADAETALGEVVRLTGLGIRAARAELKSAEADRKRHRAVKAITQRKGGRTPIMVQPDRVSDMAMAAERAIVESADPGDLIVYGDVLATIRDSAVPHLHAIDDRDAPPPPVPTIVPLNRASLLAKVEKYAVFMQPTQGGPDMPVGVPGLVLEVLMRGREHVADRISGLLAHPTVMPSGEVIATPGLHRISGMFYRGTVIGGLRAYSQKEAADARLRILSSLFGECAFASDRDGDAALALLLTGIERRMTDASPGFLVRATQQASGKTTLVRLVHLVLTGRDLPVATATDDVDEMRKQLLSWLMRSPTMIAIDNVEDGHTFRCPPLAAAMTAPTYTGRILGESRDVEVPVGCTFVMTGNAVELGRDELSRWVPIDLAVGSRPEERRFRHGDVVGRALSIRDEVLRDVIGIVAGYRSAGKRIDPKTRFPRWDGLVRQPLIWAGGCDMADVLRESSVGSEVAAAQIGLMMALHQRFGVGVRFTAQDVVRAIDTAHWDAADSELPADFGDRLRSALESIPVKDTGNPRSVGLGLKKVAGRVTSVPDVGDVVLGSQFVRGAIRWMLARPAVGQSGEDEL